jgi:hypothetical protein|tara:strand:+ start:37 stop:642 length:606 start_codon:yes stop_codon:yes gene_type:complete
MSLKFANNNSLSAITALPAAVSGGSLNLISTQTASSSATISFTSGIDDTYKEYIIKWINVHPATDDVDFKFQGSIDGGSNYNVSITSTWFEAYHDEGDSGTSLGYSSGRDQGNGTSLQFINNKLGNDNDQSGCGTLHLFNPSDTTFVKHFSIASIRISENNFQAQQYCAGYFNTTSAINAIVFQMSSGNIDSGTFKLYGVS